MFQFGEIRGIDKMCLASKQTKNKNDKIKVLSAEIVVHGTIEKPYYEIKYYDLSDRKYHIGYSSYDLNNVFRWREECFEIVKENEHDMISKQIKELRELSDGYTNRGHRYVGGKLYQAANTIESLSAKPQAANMERSADNGSGWIPCKERLPETVEYMEFEPTPYMKRLEIAYMTDTVEYLIGFYDGSKWMDKHHNIIKNVIAWKPFAKLPDKRHEP